MKYGLENVTTKTVSCPVDIIDIYSQQILPYKHLPPCFTDHLQDDYIESPDESSAKGSRIHNCVCLCVCVCARACVCRYM